MRRKDRERFALGIVLLSAFACSGDGAGGGVTPLRNPPGSTPPLDVSGWVSASDGTVPLVIVAPHGGDLTPGELPDRTCAACVTVNDANTRALATEISDAFERRIGRRPFVVANRLNRRKFDANRDRAEATGGYAALDPMFELFHLRVDSAAARAARVHPSALLIDLHGHAHSVARLEIGYLLSASELRLADSTLSPLLAASSIARLNANAVSGDRGAALLRGARALGTRLAVAGFPSVPSASDAAPSVGEDYFNGGYNTARHGSLTGGPVDAVQIECNFTGVRDSAANRTAFAEALVTTLLAFLADQYGWQPA